jgi:hypothetical protein
LNFGTPRRRSSLKRLRPVFHDTGVEKRPNSFPHALIGDPFRYARHSSIVVDSGHRPCYGLILS